MTRVLRGALLALGLAVTAYGVVLLLALGWGNTGAALVWLVGGVVLHDGVLATLTLLVSLAALRLARPDRLAPWVVALVVLAPVTLAGVPELGRFGARADNPTLLDRSYWLGWSVMVTLVLACVLAGTVARRRWAAARGGGDDTGAGGR